jgi:hypothetical protein
MKNDTVQAYLKRQTMSIFSNSNNELRLQDNICEADKDATPSNPRGKGNA